MREMILGLGLILMACGGVSDDPPVEQGGEQESAEAAPTAPDRDPTVPLCEEGDEPQPGDCQTLVYRLASGYCERFSPCSEL